MVTLARALPTRISTPTLPDSARDEVQSLPLHFISLPHNVCFHSPSHRAVHEDRFYRIPGQEQADSGLGLTSAFGGALGCAAAGAASGALVGCGKPMT